MDRDTMFQKIQQLVAEVLEVDINEIEGSTTLNDLGADSFDKLELITAFEDEFDIQFDDEVLQNINSIDDAIDAIDDVR